MASSQGQQQPAQSPFKLFSRVPWANRNKKPKQGSLGEENNMYYHPELKRWVEKGKEEEAEREASGPPPPPVMSGASLASAPLSKRSLSQRYVLQPNLSISSSMASLAGSLSQTDIAGLVGACQMESFSGPPSAIGSTAPSPPQSSNCLLPPASFTASGPPSGTGLSLSSAPNSFFVPTQTHRAVLQPIGSSFFIPKPPTGNASESMVPVVPTPDQPFHGGQDDADAANATPTADNAKSSVTPGDGNGHINDAMADGNTCSKNAVLPPNEAAQTDDACTHGTAGIESSAVDTSLTAEGSRLEYSVSFSDTLKQRLVESPADLSYANSVNGTPKASDHHQQPPAFQPLPAQESRHLAVMAANASDGGAAISLHDGMGLTPMRPRSQLQVVDDGERLATIKGVELAAVGEDDALVDSRTALVADEATEVMSGQAASPLANGHVGLVGEGSCGEEVTGATITGSPDGATDAPAVTGEAGNDTGGASTLYSQYYYQQYARLHEYALGLGYGEADAIAYAHYYAAMYAHQYEAQTPEGNIGGGAYTAAGDGEGSEVAPFMHVEHHQQLAVVGVETEMAEDALAGTSVAALATEVVETATVAEDEAPAAAASHPVVKVVDQSEDPVYVAAVEPAYHAMPDTSISGRVNGLEPIVEAEISTVMVTAAPLPFDLTAAATAAAQHHQSAVTAVVAAAAAAVEQRQQEWASGLCPAEVAGSVAAADAAADQSANPTASLAPQLLLGLGAVGARRFTQLSSAVASLGTTVAAAAPVAAALSAAASTAAAAGVGFVGLDSAVGLSEEDFDRIMHPGDPAKLDGPLPWELPEHLRTSRKFLALCANWQLANHGQSYTPQLLQQLQEQQQRRQEQQQRRQAEASEVAPQKPQQGLEALATKHAGMAPVAEGGTKSAGGWGPLDVKARQEGQQQGVLVAEDLSSYERACRLAEFGQPVLGLLPRSGATQEASTAEPNLVLEHHLPSRAQDAIDNGKVTVGAAPSSIKPVLDAPESSASTTPTAGISIAPGATPLDLSTLPALESHHDHQLTPGSACSDDLFAGVAPIPTAHQLQQQQQLLSPRDVAKAMPYGGVTLEQVVEQERQSQDDTAKLEAARVVAEAAETSPEVCSFARLDTAEATSFFDGLGDHAPKITGDTPAVDVGAAFGVTIPAEQVPNAVTPTGKQAEATASVVENGVPDSGVAITASAAATAAAAIDSVVQALEQLRNSAADGSNSPMVDLEAGTALLLQIQSSLAQATEALAGMGVDVSALTSLTVAPRFQALSSPAAWTPSASHKRPRVDASPTTPTRAAVATEYVATPILQPGPPIARPVEAATLEGAMAAGDPGQRFQQLGRRLSDATDELSGKVDQSLSAAIPQQQLAVAMLNTAALPELDVASTEERVRTEERALWEARLEALIDSERNAAALVIAAAERERDGLHQRCGELEAALAAVTAERDGLAQRLQDAETDCKRAQKSRASAEAEHGALAAKLSAMTEDRDALTDAVTAERLEKAALAESLAAACVETEDLRRRYKERFSALNAELEATRGSLVALQGEHDELLLCLGQESTKVAVLTDALRDAGGDPGPLLDEIEAEYATMEVVGDGLVAP